MTTVRVTLTYDVVVDAPSGEAAVEGLSIPTPEFGIVPGYPTSWSVLTADLVSYDTEVL